VLASALADRRLLGGSRRPHEPRRPRAAASIRSAREVVVVEEAGEGVGSHGRRREAEHLPAKLSLLPIDAIYSSPMERVRETAEKADDKAGSAHEKATTAVEAVR